MKLLPLVKDINYQWDAAAAAERVKEWATEDDAIDLNKYNQAFFLGDDEDSKLIFADVVDGELRAVWAGVNSVMAELSSVEDEKVREDIFKSVLEYAQAFQEVFKVQETEEAEEEESEEETEKYFVKASYNPKEKLAVASTDVEDRHGERISQEGWKLKNFKTNPVLLWAHDHTEIAVGNAKNIHIQRSGGSPRLVFTPDFHEETDKARALKALYEGGRLNSFSVGFVPIDFDGATATYEKQELLEISAVNVPANPEARMLAYKSLVDKGFKKKVAKDVSGLDKIPAKKFIEMFKAVRGPVADEVEDEEMFEKKAMKMETVYKIFWAFMDVYYDEETAVEDFDKLLSEMIGLLSKIVNGEEVEESYGGGKKPRKPGNKPKKEAPETPEQTPEETPEDGKVIDKNEQKQDIKTNKVKTQANKDTSVAPKTGSDKQRKQQVKLRSQQSLVKTIAKASDKLLAGEKIGIGQNERVDYTKVIKRAAEILSVSHKKNLAKVKKK